MTETTAPTRILPIVNEKGLHARASAKFAEVAEQFDARAQVTRDGETVDARSVLGLLTLAAAQGASIAVTAEGPEADALIVALSELVANRFGEER